MALSAKAIMQARAVVEKLNANFKENGLQEDAFKLIEKEIDGEIQYFFEFSLPEFGIRKLTAIQLSENEEAV